MVEFRNNGKYSQFGEEGIINEALRRMGIEIGTCCEFGAADGYFCSNTRHLVDNGWMGTFLEANNGQFVTPENVNDLVPAYLHVLSIDIDGNDYAVWKAYQGKAKLVIIEVNSSFPEGVMHFSEARGSSFSMMVDLGKKKGYTLIAHTANCIFVLNEYAHLFPEPVTFDKAHLLNQ